MNDTIPKGWRKVKLGEVCKLLRGKGISKGQVSETGKNKCVLYGELYTTYSEIIKEVKSKTDCDEGTKSKKGDILIPGSTTTTGIDLANAVALNEDNVLLGGDINILRKKDDSYNSEFLAYYLTHIKKGDIMRLTQGITIVHLYGKHLEEIELLLPPRELQDKLADIIKTTDEAIGETDNIIKESTKIKKGLLKQVFTKGMHKCKLKATKIGDIPDNWTLVTVQEANVKVIDGDRGVNYPKQQEFSKEGYCLFLNAGNVTKQGFRFKDTTYITKEKDVLLRKGKLSRNDVVLTTRGTVGNIGFYGDDITDNHIRINSGMVILRSNNGKILPEYLYYVFRSHVIQKQIDKISFGSAQPQLTVKEINKFKFPLPSEEEQREIIEFIRTLNGKISLEKNKKRGLIKTKKGLMQKLLTGQIRVKVD